MVRSTSAVRLLAGDKEPVRLASTADLALAGLLTVDGVVTVAGDRVLVKDQTDATANGIYTASAGTWHRATDANTSRALTKGMNVFVQEGTVNEGLVFVADVIHPDLGDDDITFSVGPSMSAFADAVADAEAFALAAQAVSDAFARPATLAALKAFDTTLITTAYLTLEGSEGVFNWRAGDYTARIAADPTSRNYVKADAIAESAGAWVRAGGVVAVSYPGGRITLTTGVAVMTTDVAGATTVYYTPASGRQIPIYDGSEMISTSFSELSQTTTDATKSPAAVAASSIYDLFVWNDNGTIRCTRGPAWTNDTTRASALTLVQGTYLNASSITNGPAASRGTYVGSIRSNASSTIDMKFGSAAAGGGPAWFGIFNNYNRVPGAFWVYDNTGVAWTVGTTLRALNNSNNNRVSILHGLDEDAVSATLGIRGVGVASQQLRFSFGLDSTTAAVTRGVTSYSNGVVDVGHTAVFNGMIGLGFHYLQAQEASTGGSAQARMQDTAGGLTGISWW